LGILDRAVYNLVSSYTLVVSKILTAYWGAWIKCRLCESSLWYMQEYYSPYTSLLILDNNRVYVT
jgi:hypothetical protein